MKKPSITDLLTKADNRYELVIASSKRARQIVQKAVEERNEKKQEAINNSSNNSNNNNNNVAIKENEVGSKVIEESPVKKAATEIMEGKVKIINPKKEEE